MKKKDTETKKLTIEEKIFDVYKHSEAFLELLTENGKLLLGQITNGTKTVDNLSDRDKGRWKSVLKSFEKWGGEQMYALWQASEDVQFMKDLDEPKIAETIHEDGTIESDTEPPTDDDYEPDYMYQDTRQPDENLTDEDYEAIQKEFDVDLPDKEDDWNYNEFPRDEPTDFDTYESADEFSENTNDESKALVKREDDDGAIQGEVELPMTEAEIKRREVLETEFRIQETAVKNVRYAQGEILKEIIDGRLYRNTHKTFGEYALETFNLTREYAIQIANISHYPQLLAEAIDPSESVRLSINAGIAMDKQIRQLADETGFGREFEMMRPVIVDSFRALVDIAPKDKAGKPVLSPPLVTKYGEVMREVVQSGTVVIDGEQMTIHEAKEKGLLQHGLQMEVLTATEETIRAKQDYISEQAKERYERKTTPVIPNKRSTSKEVYVGQVPQLDVECTIHGETEVISIGNGTFQTKCLCRWQIDNDTETLTCFEAEKKRI